MKTVVDSLKRAKLLDQDDLAEFKEEVGATNSVHQTRIEGIVARLCDEIKWLWRQRDTASPRKPEIESTSELAQTNEGSRVNMLNRVKISYVDPMLLVDVFNGLRGKQVVCLPELSEMNEIPDGTTVLNVWSSTERRAIGVMLQNDEWPEVPEGEIPPDIEGHTLAREVFVRRPIEATHTSKSTIEA